MRRSVSAGTLITPMDDELRKQLQEILAWLQPSFVGQLGLRTVRMVIQVLSPQSSRRGDGRGAKVAVVDHSGANWSTTRAYYFVKKHTYDRASRTIVVELPTHTINGSSYYAYQDTYYDSNGNVTEKQLRQVNQSDATDTAVFPSYVEYDLANRVVKESKLVSTETDKYDRIESTYGYDEAGRRTSTNRGGLVVQTSYDSAGRVSEVRKGSPGCGCGGGCGAKGSAATAGPAQEADLPIWRKYEYDAAGNRIAYSDPSGVFASATHDAGNRPVATTDRAGRVTRREYWAAGQLKREIRPDGSFTGYEYDIEGRMTKVWASVPERNSSQGAGPFEIQGQVMYFGRQRRW